MINYGLAKEIYGVTPWCVDQTTLPVLMGLLNSFQSGVRLELPEIKYNTPQVLDLSNSTKIIDRPYGTSENPGQLDNQDSFEGIGIININGPITVSGGASSYGMDYVSSTMLRMAKDERIISFVVRGDSGGGASAAVEIMTDTITEVKETKPVYGHVKKGGTAASAMYGILSACTAIYAASEMSVVGSVGTMIQFEGNEANTEDKNGIKRIRLYAPSSTHKNKWYEEALNNDNYELITDEILKPVNQRFLQLVLTNRPQLEGSSFDNGHTVFAKDGIGTFIDGIKSFSEVLELAEANKHKNPPKNLKQSNNIQGKKMTKDELKQNHPNTYNSIFNAGIQAEKDRVGAWMAHAETNMDTVKKGIKSGESISATEREELFVEAANKKRLQDLEADSAEDLTTPESKKGTEDTTKEAVNFYADINNKIKQENGTH